jgi:hypothetical protein
MFCAPGIIFDGSNTFSADRMALCPVFFFCVPRLVFDGTERVGSRFYVLRAKTSFQQYRGCRVSFSAVPRAVSPVLTFYAPRLVFGSAEYVESRFHVLRARTRFRRYRGRRDLFLLTDLFSAVPRASRPVLMSCLPGLIFGGTEGVTSLFHVLRSRTRFQRYRRRRVSISCFAAGPIFSGNEGAGSRFHVFAPGLVFGGTEGVRSRF